MPSGVLGQAAPAAATNTTVYTVPATKLATCNVSIANTSGSPIAFRLAVASTGTPATSEWLAFDVVLPGNGNYERGGIVAQAAENIVVFAAFSGLSVSVYGYEE